MTTLTAPRITRPVLKTKPARSIELDFLRICAAFMVIGHHMPRTGIASIDAVLAGGWVGVDLFFVLSGFLISGLLLDEYKKRHSVRVGRFLIRRALKLYPAYLVLLLYTIFAAGKNGAGAAVDTAVTLGPNFLFLQNYFGADPLGHTWSLAVEEHFYLLMPFLMVLLAMRNRLHWIPAICVAISLACLGMRYWGYLAGEPWNHLYSRTHYRIDALMFGVAIRTCKHLWPAQFAAVGAYRWLLILAGLACWAPLTVMDRTPAFLTIGLTFTMIGAGLILMGVYHLRLPHQFKPLAWLGTFSYSIYLWHAPILGMIGARVHYQWWIVAIVVVVTCLTVGVIAASVIEIPVLRLRDRFWPSANR
jgi:peptidoglycan/LPS O-acetylase OafA/YrhL